MACADIDSIRNIGIIAHIDAGKTTLSERMLFYCEKIHRLGEVHDGAATMDYMPEEQERGITITSACSTLRWNDKHINLIDTPGHVDFTIEVERSLRVLDGAVGVFCAVGGVEPQSETVWRQSESFKVPKIAFINKMDRTGANFDAVLEAMKKRLGANPLPLMVPVGEGETFRGVIDLVNSEILEFDQNDHGRTFTRRPLTGSEDKYALPLRDGTLEKLAEADEAFLELWLEGNYTVNDIHEAIRRTTISRAITPVLCGSALRNTGVQPLLDAVCAYLPSPRDLPDPLAFLPDGAKTAISPDNGKPPVALIFKVIMDGSRKISFLRLYEGKIREGDQLANASTGKMDRIGRLFRMHADRQERIDELCAGDICAAIGLRDAGTGQTYCSKDHIVSLEPITAYAPVITLALEPKNADEGKLLDEALARYLEEDPTLKLVMDEETGLRMLSGMGELHLEVVLERLAREYKISPRAGQPQVVLRETITAPSNARALFDKELGKERHVGEVELEIAPAERNNGNKIKIGAFLPEDKKEARKLLPQAILDAALEGIKDGLQSGVQGWPVVDVEVTLANVKRKEGFTTIPGTHMAAGQALREALEKASPVTLEPIMDVEITTPEEFLGAVIGLFNQTGGKIDALEDHAGVKRLSGTAPLRRLFGFSTQLRSASQGKAGFMLTFKTFDLS